MLHLAKSARALVLVLGVVMHKRCIVLDLIGACEVIETERPDLPK